MNFFKPKFWDKNQVSLFSILLFPITLLIKLLVFFKLLQIKRTNRLFFAYSPHCFSQKFSN